MARDKIQIINDFKEYALLNYIYKLLQIYKYISKNNFENSKYSFFIILLVSIVYFTILDIYDSPNKINLKSFKKYVRDSKKLIKYSRKKKNNKYPYVTICIPALNMENYIKQNILSILNQSFQNFEIIIVNDGSTDKTQNIIKKIQSNEKRIKLLSHDTKLGVYRSRFESILNSRSKYIILLDPDDLYLNENLLLELYKYNLKKNLDIIEFTVYEQFEGQNKITLPDNDFHTHYHKFNETIIYQPKLSEILFYLPETKQNTRTICRNIWNKMINKIVLLKTNNYIGKEYYNKILVTSDDMMINIIAYQFAKNYSNINLPGYLYIKRKKSMSRGGNIKTKVLRANNYFFYFKLLYNYIKDYNKDRNILFYEMKDLESYIYRIKDNNNNKKYKKMEINLIKKILKENELSIEFQNYLQNVSIFLIN